MALLIRVVVAGILGLSTGLLLEAPSWIIPLYIWALMNMR